MGAMPIGYGAIHPCLKSAIEIAPVTIEKGMNKTPMRLSQLTAKGALAAESNRPIKYPAIPMA